MNINFLRQLRHNTDGLVIRVNSWLQRHGSTILIVIIAILVGLIFLLLVIQNNESRRQVEEHRAQSESTLEEIKVIGRELQKTNEEIKKLSTDNKAIAQRNEALSVCIVKLLADYTVNQMPIIIEDLDGCVTRTLEQSASPETPPSFLVPRLGQPPAQRTSPGPTPRTPAPAPTTPPKSKKPSQHFLIQPLLDKIKKK